jgi:hypothetical protein
MAPLYVERHSKADAVRFDARWRTAVKTLASRRVTHDDAVDWTVRARDGLYFATDEGTESGRITFEPGEKVPSSSELCGELSFGSIWYFDPELTWALHVEHDSWETGRVFELEQD